MKLYIISFTSRGRQLAQKTASLLSHHNVTLFQGEGQEKITLRQFAERGFEEAEGLIFISATGIAVRAIAPVLQQKLKDPAVVVMDDNGNFVISLLSGHWGGANELTLELASKLDGTPVVTTGADRQGVFSVDSYARHQGFNLVHPEKIREISEALFRNEPVLIYSTFPLEGLAKGLEETPSLDKAHIIFDRTAHNETLTLIPRDYVLGINCPTDTNPDNLLKFVEDTLRQQGILRTELRGITSVTTKECEKAIISLSQRWDLPYITFSKEELLQIPGEFTPSTFVLEQVGTDNLCERSAVAWGGGTLILKKTIHKGMTLAIAQVNRVIAMDEFGTALQ